MRKKVKKLVLTDATSQRVMDLLVMRNGDDTLYDLCNYIGFDPASFRRKLEREDGWKEIGHINGILDYLGLSYEVVFRGGKYDLEKQIEGFKKEIAIRDEKIQQLKEVVAKILNVEDSLVSTEGLPKKKDVGMTLVGKQ